MSTTPRRIHPFVGPISLAVGIVVLLSGLLVNGCRISKLLSSSSGTSGGVTPGGTISVSPRQVLDSALAGETIPHESNLAVSNGGAWFATTASPWIRITPDRGASRAIVRLSLDPSGLPAGLHAGVVTVQEHDSTGPTATVAVSFRIQQPILKVTPGSINHTAQTSNSVFYDTLVVTNAGDGPLVWRATTQDHSSWLVLSDTTGAGAGKIAVRVSNAGLAYFGTFHETIIVTAPGAKNSPARISVTLKRSHKHDGDVPTP